VPSLLLSGLARSVMFAPIDPGGGRVEAVANRLSDSISLGMLRDGDQLPAQQDLAGHLGVSLITLRDALALLKERGLIETRRGHGGGSFVKVDEQTSTSRGRAALQAMSSHDIGDLLDMQRAVSGQAARLAADRHSWDFVSRLGELVTALEAATEPPVQCRIDGRFRVEVAATAQSVRLTRAEMRLQAEAGPLRWLPELDESHREDVATLAEYHREVVASHRALVEAIGRHAHNKAQSIAEARVDADLARMLALHIQALEL
jgi:GntR family transcriptional repressor for pyruvate dehydrogenase complex